MDMEDCLAGVAIAVENGSIPALLKPAISCDQSSLPNHATDELIVCLGDVVDGGDVSTRYDECMKWCLRVDVLDHNQRFIFVDDLCLYFVRDDLAEQTIGHDTLASEEIGRSGDHHRTRDTLEIAPHADDPKRRPARDHLP